MNSVGNMVKTYLRAEPAPRLFLAKVMGSRSEIRDVEHPAEESGRKVCEALF